MLHFRLRGKILLLVVVAPIVLAAGALFMVNQSFTLHARASIDESLKRSAAVFERMMRARSQTLYVAAQVIVRDPRFFSVLTVPGAHGDPSYRATVKQVASDFNRITQADLFEVFDNKGRLLASAGRAATTSESRAALVVRALSGQRVAGILVLPQAHCQVHLMPIFADQRVVGVLLLGAGLGGKVASELKNVTQSEVTFVSGPVVTGSTLRSPDDRQALLRALPGVRPESNAVRFGTTETRIPSGRYLTLVGPIPGSDLGDRQLFVMQRSLDPETAFIRKLQGRLIQLGIAALAAALLFGFLVSERITGPILRLVRGAEEMERGNYEFPLQVRRGDEIGYLADRFKVMRQRERVYVKSLEDVARLKSEFINVASHELRTPITIIQGFHELFSHGVLGPVTAPQQEALGAIEDSLVGLVRIAENATRVAQIGGERLILECADHDVNDMVSEAIAAAVADGPGRDLDMTAEIDPDLGTVHVDGSRLTQAVAHLVKNGIRFTPDGGRVIVTAHGDGEALLIEVRDSGIGIAPDRIPHLFGGPFVVRDSQHHHSSSTLEFGSAGLGLGLSIAHGIIESHGGTIEVESVIDHGSRFAIRIPGLLAARLDKAA